MKDSDRLVAIRRLTNSGIAQNNPLAYVECMLYVLTTKQTLSVVTENINFATQAYLSLSVEHFKNVPLGMLTKQAWEIIHAAKNAKLEGWLNVEAYEQETKAKTLHSETV